MGITLDNKLTGAVINTISKKLASSVYLIRQLARYLDLNILLTAYHAIFHSGFNYGVSLWRNALRFHCDLQASETGH